MKLYYNAAHPIEILQSLTVLTSKMCGRDRGVSFSSEMLNSHGAFTFVFAPDRPWYAQCIKVKYGNWKRITLTRKSPLFRQEKEWWSSDAIRFSLEDVEAVIFRYDSPARRIHPRKTVKIAKQLKLAYPHLHQELRYPN